MTARSPDDDRTPGDGTEPPGPGGALDPADWPAFRRTAHEVLDDLIDYLRDVRDRPVWRPVPEEVKDRVGTPAPSEPGGLEAAWREAKRSILPYAVGNVHPRFFGWVHGTGTPGGVVAEMIAATMNSNVGGRDHGAVYVERQVVDWWRRLFGLPEGAAGVVTTGTSMANLVGLTVARNGALDRDVRRAGLGEAGGRLRAYASEQTHGSVRKALEVLGLGRESLVEVPVDDAFRVDVAELERRMGRDRERGLEPFCVVGNAGTVNTGAVDDLRSLGELCRREGVWYHVDGAFGALAVLGDEHRGRVDGIELADSLAFDFHKWLHVPYDAGCVLVRDGALQRRAFASEDAYLRRDAGGVGGGDPWFTDFGVELSRGFRALKVWMTVREHGLERIGRAVDRNCRQARYLADRIVEAGDLELAAPVGLNVVCFRYLPEDDDREEAELDELNRRILVRLHREGSAVPSSTTLRGKTVLRAALTNHRTRREDLDLLLDRTRQIGRELSRGTTDPEAGAPGEGRWS